MRDAAARAADVPIVDEASAVPFVTAAELRESEIREALEPSRLVLRIHRLEEDNHYLRGWLLSLQREVVALRRRAP